MNPSILSGSRKHLVNQLIFFDESSSVFFDTYFPEPNKERIVFEKQLRRYWQTLEEILDQDDESLNRTLQSKALVGSSVKIRYEEDGLDETFTVVYPTEIDPDKNRISFLSPIGKQLLLTSIGDQLTLETPVDNHKVRVEEVKLAYINGFENL